MLTLQNVMKLEPFNKCTLLTDINLNKDREITGITIAEAPDIAAWIKPGTIVLTNLYSLASDIDGQLKMVGELSQVVAGALIIKTHRYVDRVSRAVITYANELGLPLLELPKEITYTDLSSALMGELFNEQVNRLNYFKLCHDRFKEVSMNLGLDAAVEVLSELLDKKVSLERDEREPIRSRNTSQPKSSKYYRRNIHTSGPYKTKLIIEDMDYPSELEAIAVDMAITSIILILNKELAIEEEAFRSKTEFMNDLLYGRAESREDCEKRASIYGWKLNQPSLVMALSLEGKGEEFSEATLLRDMAGLLKSRGLKEIHMKKNGSYIFFIQATRKEIELEEVLQELLQEFLRKVSAKDQGLALGVGGLASDSSGIKKSFKESMDSIDLIKRQIIDSRLVVFDELGIYKLLGRYDKRSELLAYIPKKLLLLQEHDREKSDSLTKTLASYLENNMNAKKTSRELFIHHKTVAYRLEKIEELVGLDLEDRRLVIELEVGLKILKLLGQANDDFTG